jgi:hypothetical protein
MFLEVTMKNHKDTESVCDTLGMNLQSHLSFGISRPSSALTSILVKQSTPESIIDNIEQKS